MSRRFHVAAIAGLMTLVLAGVSAYAQGPAFGEFRGRGPGAGAGPGFDLPLRQLDLTEAQQEQVGQLAQQHRPQMRGLIDQVRKAQEVRRQAIQTLPVDEGRIRAAMQELAAAEAELAVQQARLQSEIFALLTAEQQQRLQQLRAEREARLRQRRGQGSGIRR